MRNVVPKEEALGWKSSLDEYVELNETTGASFVSHRSLESYSKLEKGIHAATIR